MNWFLSDAKTRFEEVLDRATREGEQRIQRRKEFFFVVSEADYEKLKGKSRSNANRLSNGLSFEDLHR